MLVVVCSEESVAFGVQVKFIKKNARTTCMCVHERDILLRIQPAPMNKDRAAYTTTWEYCRACRRQRENQKAYVEYRLRICSTDKNGSWSAVETAQSRVAYSGTVHVPPTNRCGRVGQNCTGNERAKDCKQKYFANM